MSAFDRVAELGKRDFGLQVKFKDESLLMRLLGVVLFFNPKFMTEYTTTIGKTVYFANRKWVDDNSDSAAHVLAHELVHIGDSVGMGSFLFSYTYLFPQCFALFALLSFVSWWWLLCLLFLSPIPAPWRTYWELRGYAMTDATYYRSNGEFTDIDWMAGQFTSGAYLFMWPFKADIRNRIERNRHLISRGKLSDQIGFADRIIACF